MGTEKTFGALFAESAALAHIDGASPKATGKRWTCPTCGGHELPEAWGDVGGEWESLSNKEREIASSLLELIHSSHETASGLPGVLRVLLPSLSDIAVGLDPDYFLLGFKSTDADGEDGEGV